MKYSNQRSAAKAAKKEFGARWFDHCEIENLDGGWFIQLTKALEDETPVGAWKFPKAADFAPVPPVAEKENGAAAFFKSWVGPVAQPEVEESEEMSDEELEAEAKAAEKKADEEQASFTSQHNGKAWRKFSIVAKPTKLVWIIADKMNEEAEEAGKPAPTRKEVQDACIFEFGIASGTARTQYQH